MGVCLNPTLCWDCENALGGCSWSDHWKHEPVKGWTAVRRDLRIKEGGEVESYRVIQCPEFVRDSTRGGQYRYRRKQNGPGADGEDLRAD